MLHHTLDVDASFMSWTYFSQSKLFKVILNIEKPYVSTIRCDFIVKYLKLTNLLRTKKAAILLTFEKNNRL